MTVLYGFRTVLMALVRPPLWFLIRIGRMPLCGLLQDGGSISSAVRELALSRRCAVRSADQELSATFVTSWLQGYMSDLFIDCSSQLTSGFANSE
jgi:hypothetical protein